MQRLYIASSLYISCAAFSLTALLDENELAGSLPNACNGRGVELDAYFFRRAFADEIDCFACELSVVAADFSKDVFIISSIFMLYSNYK